MDPQTPALYSLPVDLAHHVLRHLGKRDKQQFALCCKHANLCALAAIRALVLSHKCLTTTKPLKMKKMKHCTTVTLRPRTMDELTNLAALLLVHNTHHFPTMNSLRLELLNVYDKQCDVSLILKSVALHVKQLTQLYIEQEAQLSLKAMAATAELPLLEWLVVKSRSGFEPGALGQLSRAVNLTQLHLEVLPDSSSSAPISPSATAAGGPSKSPSELARLQAADEVGLAKMGGQLLSCTAIGFSTASSIRPITALLAAVAGSPKPHMAELQLGAQEVSSQSISLIASISSLSCLKLLPGCELASPLDLARLSTLAGLTQLLVAPCMPPAPVLTAWAKGCKRLASLGVCAQPGPLPLMPAMTGITDLQLLSSSTSRSRYGGSSNGGTGSGSSSPTRLSVDLGSLAVTLRSPLSLSGLDTLWPRLVSLEVVGWALDAGSMSAIKQLDTLSSIKLQGGREPGTALHARLLLPLLDKPGLRRLLLLEVSDLSDAWVSEAMMRVTGPCADGSLPAVSELHLGAAADTTPAPSAANGGGSSSNGSSSGVANLRASFSGNSGLAGSSSGDGGLSGSQGSRQMLTDKGLVRLVAWPRLTKLVLVGLPDITLAGVKALVAGSNSLSELTVKACPAVSAAPPDSIARAALGPGAKAVDLWVS